MSKGQVLLLARLVLPAYQDIFTLTLVLGRTAGIGAYLVRLGQRTIQLLSTESGSKRMMGLSIPTFEFSFIFVGIDMTCDNRL